MTDQQNHIIYRHTVELEFYNQKENLFIQNRISNIVKDKLLPAMESLFNEQTSPGQKIKIDALNLNLGEIKATGWEDTFVSETIYRLRQKLREVIAFSSAEEVYEVSYIDETVHVNNIQAIDEQVNNVGVFLQSGVLPWSLTHITATDLLNEIFKADRNSKLTAGQRENLIQYIFNSETALERFILQFDDAAILYCFDNILQVVDAGETFSSYKNFFSTVQPSSISEHQKKLLVWLFVLIHFKAENKTDPAAIDHLALITGLLKKNISITQLESVQEAFPDKRDLDIIFQKSAARQVFEKEYPYKAKNGEKEFEEYFINNAGLVILSPFLKQMFASLNLCRKKHFRSELEQMHAVLLSQYLVTGATKIAEHELPLNKILCGLPLNKTLPAEFNPSEKEAKRCDELLHSVLEYWAELKSTSAEALRHTYIIRNGKLIDKEDYWLLIVEYKTYDIMLQFLPWTIGVIYLPWMKKRLMVEWHA
jgi:hypothetical protein